MKKTTTPTLVSLRAQRGPLLSERASLEQQPRGQQDAREVISAGVENIVSDWRDRQDLAIRQIAGGHRAAEALKTLLDPRGAAVGEAAVDQTALIGLLGDALLSGLLARVDAVVPEGPNASERLARIADIDVELRRVEAAEEALICEAEERGQPVARRADCDPSIVLAWVGGGDEEAGNDAPPETPQSVIDQAQDEALRAAAAERHAENTQPVRSPYMARRP